VKFAVDPTRVPEDAHMFRVARWNVAVVVSQAMKDEMERVGCLGAKFVRVA
jgi:hypothetical protein